MDWPAVVAIGGLIGTVLAILTFWTRFSDRITVAEAAANVAREIAQEAKKDAHEASEKTTLLSAAFSLYREQIAREYIHREVMREVEERLTQAIDRLGERLDRVLEKRSVT